MKSQDRVALDAFPEDWRYYTLTYPVARYKHLSLDGIIQEMMSCTRRFYSMPRILRRVCGSLLHRRRPLIALVGSLSYRSNIRVDRKAYADFRRQHGQRCDAGHGSHGQTRDTGRDRIRDVARPSRRDRRAGRNVTTDASR